MENFDWQGFVIIPLLIFLARMLDVPLSTIRIMFIMAGRKRIAPILGAIEVLIWLVAIGQIMQRLDNWVCYLAYAAGFGCGTYLGMRLEESLAYGTYVVRVITDRSDALVDYLKEQDFGVTRIHGDGNNGAVDVIFLIIKRSRINDVQNIISQYAPDSVYTIGSVKFANNNSQMPTVTDDGNKSWSNFLGRLRKGK